MLGVDKGRSKAGFGKRNEEDMTSGKSAGREIGRDEESCFVRSFSLSQLKMMRDGRWFGMQKIDNNGNDDDGDDDDGDDGDEEDGR